MFSSLPITTTQAAVIKSLIENGNQFSYIRNPQPLTRSVALWGLNRLNLAAGIVITSAGLEQYKLHRLDRFNKTDVTVRGSL